MRQQSITRIFSHQLGRGCGTLAISGARDQFSQQRLHIPMQIVLEVQSEVVKKLRVAGLLTHAAEVFLRLDDSDSKKLLPIAIDGNASSQWLTGLKEPFSQGQAVARSTRRQPGKYRRHIRSKVWAYFGKEVAAFEFKCCPAFIRLLFYHDGQRNAGNSG